MKALIALVFIFSFATQAKAEKWKMTTLEWPPFTCEKCPDQGAGSKALKEALKSVGVELELVFLPWTRAVKDAGDAKAYVGGYPFWPEDVPADQGFVPSASVFKSPIGFVEPKGKALSWEKLTDLKGKTIGSVQDYGNTKEFNALLDSGVIKKDIVVSDDINIKKVAMGRLDGAIIDLNVGKYMVQTDLASEAGKIQFNPKVVENKDLLVAFNKESKDKAQKLIEAMKKVDTQKIVEDYLKANLK